MVGLGMLAQPFVLVIPGAKWAPVIPVFRVLAVVGVFQSVPTTVGQIYVAKGRTDLMCYVGSGNTATAVAAFLAGVRYGVLEVAGSYAAACFTVQIFLSLSPALHLFVLPFRQFVRQLFPQLAITTAMGVACLLWMYLRNAPTLHSPILHLISTVVLGAVVYTLLFLRLRPAVIGFSEEVAGQDPNSKLAQLVARLNARFPARP